MDRFALTAQLLLQAPSNLQQVVGTVRNAFKDITANVRINTDVRALKDVTDDMNRLRIASQKTAGFYSEIGNILANATRRFAGISIATGTFLGLARAVKSGIGDAINFERELAKVAQATETSLNSVKRLGKEVGAIAVEFGASSNELVKFGRIFSQAGFNVKETTASLKLLAKTDLIGTFGDMANTAEGIITTLAVFSKEARGSAAAIGFLERSFDSINRVAKKYAVESEDIITAVRRTGAVFQAAGGNLNELEALFTSVRATTRESADTIANGFKTIFTRLQRKDTLEALRELGIELEDLDGKFIKPYQAIQKIGLALSALPEGSIRKNSILEQIGGVYQIGRLIPAVKNYALQQQILNESLKSQGDINKDVTISQETLSFKINKTKESFANLIRSLSDSGTFKKLAEGGLAFANSLIQITDTIKHLLPYLVAYAAYSSTKIVSSFGTSFFGGKIKQPTSSAKTLLGDTKIGGLSSGGQVGGRLRNVPGFGTDSELTALTPGEIVINRKDSKKNKKLLLAINSGQKIDMMSEGGEKGKKRRLPKTGDEALLKIINRKKYNEMVDAENQSNDGGEYNIDYNPGPNRSNKTVTQGFVPVSDEQRAEIISAKMRARGVEPKVEKPPVAAPIPFNPSRGDRENQIYGREGLYGNRRELYGARLPEDKLTSNTGASGISVPGFDPPEAGTKNLRELRVRSGKGRKRPEVQARIARIQAENEQIQQRLEEDQHKVDAKNYPTVAGSKQFPSFNGSKDSGFGLLGSNESGYIEPPKVRPTVAGSKQLASFNKQGRGPRQSNETGNIEPPRGSVKGPSLDVSKKKVDLVDPLLSRASSTPNGRLSKQVEKELRARVVVTEAELKNAKELNNYNKVLKKHRVAESQVTPFAEALGFTDKKRRITQDEAQIQNEENFKKQHLAGYTDIANKSRKKGAGELLSSSDIEKTPEYQRSLKAGLDRFNTVDVVPEEMRKAIKGKVENRTDSLSNKNRGGSLTFGGGRGVDSGRGRPPVFGGGPKGPGGPSGPVSPSSSSKSPGPNGPSGPNDQDEEVKSIAGKLTGGFNALSVGLLLGVDSLSRFDDATNSAIKSAAAMGLLIHSAVNSVLPSLLLGVPKATALLNKFGIGTSQAAKAVVASQVAETAANVGAAASENVETSANLSSAAKKSGLGVQTAVAGVAIGLGLVSAGFEYYAAKWRGAADKLDIDIDKAFTVLGETGKGDLGKIQKDASTAQKLRNDANTNENIGFGAFAGGLAGAGVGAFAGPIGIAVGAAVGAAIGGVGGFANSSGVTQNEKNALKYVIDAQYDAAKATQVFTKALEHNKRFVIRPEENFKREGIQTEDYAKKLQNILRETTLAQLEFGKREKDSFGFVKNKTSEQIKNNKKAKDTEKETIQKFKDLNNSSLERLINIIDERNKTAKSTTDINKNFNSPAVKNEIAIMRKRAIESGDDVKVFDTSIAKLFTELNVERQKGMDIQFAANAAREAEIRIIMRTNEVLGRLAQSGLNLESAQSASDIVAGKSFGGVSSNRFSDLSKVGDIKEFEKDARVVTKDLGNGGDEIANEIINVAKSIAEINKNLTAEQINNIGKKKSGVTNISDTEIQNILNRNAPSLKGTSADIQAIAKETLKGALKSAKNESIGSDGINSVTNAIASAVKPSTESASQVNAQGKNKAEEKSKNFINALDAISKLGEAVAGKSTIEQTGRDRLEQARKGSLTSADLDRAVSEREGTRRKISSINLGAAGIRGNVGQSAIRSKTRIGEIDKQLQGRLDSTKRERLELERNGLNNSLRVATDELKKMANQADRASDILGQLDREQGGKNFVKGKVDSFVTGGTQDRNSILEQFAGLQNVMNTGTFQNLPEDLRKSVSSLIDEIGQFDPNGAAVKAKNNAQANDVQRFNASLGLKTDPKLLELIRGGRTSKEDKLINELTRLNAEEKKAQDALIKVEVENTSVMTKLIGKIDQMLGGKGNVPIVPNVPVPRVTAPPVNVPVAQPLTVKEQRAQAQQEAKDRFNNNREQAKANYRSKFKDQSRFTKQDIEKQKKSDMKMMGGMMNFSDDPSKSDSLVASKSAPLATQTENSGTVPLLTKSGIESIKSSTSQIEPQETVLQKLNREIKESNVSYETFGQKSTRELREREENNPAHNVTRIPPMDMGKDSTPHEYIDPIQKAKDAYYSDPNRKPLFTPTKFDPVAARKKLDEDMAKKSSLQANMMADKERVERNKQRKIEEEKEKARLKRIQGRKDDFNNLKDQYFSLPRDEYMTSSARGSFIYASRGRGVDTVPVMTQPGEAIINKSSVNKIGRNGIQALNNGNVGGGSGINISALSSFTNNLKTTLESVIRVLPASINNLNHSLNTFTNSLNGIAQSLTNITMTHEINVDGQLNISGINNEKVAEAIKESLGKYVANKVIEMIDKNNKQFRTS